MQLFDFTKDAVKWFNTSSPSKAFTEWLLHTPPWVQLGFSGLGAKPGQEKWDQLVEKSFLALSKNRDLLLNLLQNGSWRQQVKWTMEQAENLIGKRIDYVNVVVSVGLGNRNASMGYWQGKSYTYLWLEHFLEPGSNSGYLDLGISTIPIWLSHEIGHALRYATPGTGSPIPMICTSCDPWSFWDMLEKLPLSERFLDEGVATQFARCMVPGAKDEQVLGMSEMELKWLEENGTKLLQDRIERWDLNAPNPPLEWIADSLYYDRSRLEPPWTIDRPPGRWGYFIGQRFFTRLFENDWLKTLIQPYVDHHANK